MWEFVKLNPWTIAAALAIVAAAVVGVVIGVLTKGRWKDRGLMKTSTGKPMKWDRNNFPLTVWLHPDLQRVVLNAYQAGRAYINKHAGQVIFDQGLEAPAGFHYDRLLEGHVAIAMSDEVDSSKPDHGVTSLTVIDHTGEIKNALITLPPNRDALAAPIVLHELFHALGFDHDESRSSLMHPRLQMRPQKITDHDLKVLKSVADTVFDTGRMLEVK